MDIKSLLSEDSMEHGGKTKRHHQRRSRAVPPPAPEISPAHLVIALLVGAEEPGRAAAVLRGRVAGGVHEHEREVAHVAHAAAGRVRSSLETAFHFHC